MPSAYSIQLIQCRGAAIAQWICLRFPYVPLGSTLMHTIYTFIIYSQICAIIDFAMWEKNENK